MAKLEQIVTGAKVHEIDPTGSVDILNTTWYGSESLGIVYRDTRGKPQETVLFRHDEPRLRLQEAHRQWSFDADPRLTRLAAEAQRIRLAYHFDPHLAIHSSDVDPLPTRSPPSTSPCCRASRSASCSPTTPAPARRS